MRSARVIAAAALVLAAVALYSPSATAGVLGIDFGGTYVKVAVVKPGMPFQIATNVQSKRKTPAKLGIYDGMRMIGGDAEAIATRKPKLVFSSVHRMLGANASSPIVKDFLKTSYAAHGVSFNERGGVDVSLAGLPPPEEPEAEAAEGAAPKLDLTKFSVEQIFAQLLEHVQDFTETFAGGPSRDCVLTVPPYFTQAQRRAVLDAAALTDLKVLALVDENTAAAVQFGIDRVFNETHRVLFYNVGAHAAQASVVAYDSYKKKEGGRTKDIGQGKVVGKAWDVAAGGASFDAVLVEYIADEFNAKHLKGSGDDIRKHARPIAKIKKEATRVKEILSANEEFPLVMEQLYNDVDFRLHVTRSKFEELAEAAGLFDRAVAPIARAIEDAGLEVSDIDAVEIIGGGVRVPKLKALVAKALEGKHLGVHLNGDEAMALGAAFVAANMSTAFRTRKVGMIDSTPFPISVRLSELPATEGGDAPDDDDDEQDAEQAAVDGAGDSKPKKPWQRSTLLFRRRNKLDSVKKVPFAHTRDFRVDMVYNMSEPGVVPEGTNPNVASYSVTGLSAFANGELAARLGKPKVQLSFHLDHNGIARLRKAEATLVEMIMPEPEPEDAEEEAAAANETAAADADNTTATDAEAGGDKPEAETASEAADAGTDTEAEAAKAEADADKADGGASGKSGDDSGASGSDGDQDKAAGDADKSGAEGEGEGDKAKDGEGKDGEGKDGEGKDGEGKDGAKEAEGAKKKPKKERKPRKKTHRQPLTITEDESVLSPRPLSGDAFRDAKAVLRELRRIDTERAAKEAAKNGLESFVYSTRDQFYEKEEEINAVTSEEQREEVTSKIDEISEWLYDDGEDAPTKEYKSRMSDLRLLTTPIFERMAEAAKRDEVVSTTRSVINMTRVTMQDWAESRPQVNESEREEVLAKVADIEAWLDDKVAKQAETPGHEAPVFTEASVHTQLKPLRELVQRLSRRPKPPPPKPVLNATNATNATDANTTATGEGDAGAEGGEGAEAADDGDAGEGSSSTEDPVDEASGDEDDGADGEADGDDAGAGEADAPSGEEATDSDL